MSVVSNMNAAPPLDIFEFPCSFAQQRLWIDDQLAPGNPYYNIHASIRVPTVLEAGALRRTLTALVQRHETLRTTFIERDGRPLQRVAGATTPDCVDFVAADLRSMVRAELDVRLHTLAEEEAAQPFNLECGPLLRVRLLRTDVTECVLMLTIHHIVADAWSMSVLLRELSALYREAAGGAVAALPELPIQFADYAVWQQSDQADISNATLDFWRDRLSGIATLELPTDRPRPPVASHRGQTIHFTLGDALSGTLLGFAQTQSTTPYVVLLAALAIVLQRNAGQDEVVVGAPVAGRDRPELEGLIGFFVNTLVLRLQLGGEPGFRMLVQHAQQVLHEALSHQSLPFERLVQALSPERDLSRNPLFQVSVQYLAAPGVVAAVPGPAASVLEVQRGAANFDLSFDFWRASNRIEGRVDYATDLFDTSTVQRWVGQLQRVLEQALRAPDASIEEIDLLSESERGLLLSAWAGAHAVYPRESNVAAQWAESVQRHGDALALRTPCVRWTYHQLDEQSAHYAALLAERGACAGQRIGVALARGAGQVAALIAVLRLGAAYVALDRAWPAQRLARCISDAGLALVICDQADAIGFAALGVRPLHATELRPGSFVAPPLPPIDPLDAAYVAFTSGSTGVPKGVVVPHRAVLRLVCANPQVPLAADDTMLVFAPLPFDASTLEIWGALLNGACLSIPPVGPLGLDELAQWIESERITVAWLTAGLFHQLAASHPASLASVERLYAGGDVLGSDAVRRVLTAGDGHNVVLNGYGPTENTTFTCVHAMRSAADAAPPVAIGQPIANGYVRVVDTRGRLVPVGVAGELLAGGDGVALGYCDDVAATERAFIRDPFEPTRGRVYRTGDRVRWRADGVLEFLGRGDRQVKVRGYRIEPAEVEAALRALPGVADAHVLARADASGDKRLVAYVACSGAGASLADGLQSPTQAAALLAQLGAKLPAWMMPSELHQCAELRLNANGKVDEAALDKAAAFDTPTAGDAAHLADAALQGEVEPLVAQVWSDVLGREVADARARFFTDLGGHSLLATQVVSRLNAALVIELPLAAIFEEPTLRGFAHRVEALLVAELEVQ